MKLTPQQIRSSQLGLIAQAALKIVAAEDPTILGEVSANNIDLGITMNGREVNMALFTSEVAEISSLGRSNDVLKALMAEVGSISEKMRVLDPQHIAEQIAQEFRANLSSVDLSRYMAEWVSTNTIRDGEMADLRIELERIQSQLESHIT